MITINTLLILQKRITIKGDKMSRTRLKGQVAWISGGASGIGEATAKLFALEGAKVAVVDVQAELGEAVAAQITQQGGQAIFIQCDVAQSKQVQRSIEQTVDHFGGLQNVVNSAGVVHVGALHECSEQDWDALMGVNLKSIFLAVKHGLPYLQQQPRSYVVNIASISGFVGQGQTPAYIASKSGAIGLTRAIALDYAADGLRCNAVCPGITDTPMLRYHLNTTPDPAATLANRLRRVPMGVALQPLDIAKAALYFSCEDSAGITGTSLVVDAGYTTTAEWETTGRTKFME
ncbi:MAG: SDR family oxidoreductase [Chloroflexi bacterium]|nr:SDR family oxidoreductase [Chloroflexota bacterium]